MDRRRWFEVKERDSLLPVLVELYVFDDICGQAGEVATDFGQQVGVHIGCSLGNGPLDMLVVGQEDVWLAFFQQFFDGFLFKTDHSVH